jgi:hypothetical protein
MGVHRYRNGGARISTTLWGAAEFRASPTGTTRTALSAGLLTGFVAVLLGAALATAAPAAAIDDPSRPDARVTHGPSCRPGGLVVEVVAGTAPYAVRLSTTRTPSGEDEATLQPGETVVLRTADVAHGETIDGRLEFAAQDGTGVTYVDELEEYSFTRPTQEDCDAIAAPSPRDPETGAAPATSATPTAGGDAAPSGTAGPSTEGGGSAPGAVPPTGGAAAGASRGVAAGDTVTLQGAGFLPGEVVAILLHGSGDVLATVTAGPDGTAQAEVRIPQDTDAGPVTMDMVGAESELVAGVALEVVAAETPIDADRAGDVVPLATAAAALVAAVAALFSVVGRARGLRPTIGSA